MTASTLARGSSSPRALKTPNQNNEEHCWKGYTCNNSDVVSKELKPIKPNEWFINLSVPTHHSFKKKTKWTTSMFTNRQQWSPVTFSVISFSFQPQVDRWWEIPEISKTAPAQPNKASVRSDAEMEVSGQVPNFPCQVTDQRIYWDINASAWPHKCLDQQCCIFFW